MDSRNLPLVLALVLSAVAAAGALAQDTSATLTNASSFEIHQVFLSPSQESHWGPDQLGKDILKNGMYVALTGLRCGDYDVKLVDEHGDECVLTEQRLCGDMGEWLVTDEELLACEGFQVTTASATLLNQSRWDIVHLFISPTHEAQWGLDQLGEHVLASGTSFTLTGIACGDYDVRMLDEDADECVLAGVHLCGAERVTITNEDLLACEGS